jgi:hypothetical protein
VTITSPTKRFRRPLTGDHARSTNRQFAVCVRWGTPRSVVPEGKVEEEGVGLELQLTGRQTQCGLRGGVAPGGEIDRRSEPATHQGKGVSSKLPGKYMQTPITCVGHIDHCTWYGRKYARDYTTGAFC